MSEFKASGFRDEFGSGGPDLVGITTMTSPYYFVPPSGTTAERPQSPPPGMLRFNTDIGRLEVWRNDHWATIVGEQSAPIGGRAISVMSVTIDYVTIATTGDALDFGDLQTASYSRAGVSSPTRICFGGGASPSVINTIDFIAIPTTGNASDFGDLTRSNRGMTSCSNGHGGL